MADTKYLELKDSSSKSGGIAIAPDVVESIAGITVDQIDGAHLISNNISKGFNTILGRDAVGAGTKLIEDERGLVIRVNVMLDFGVSVPQVATKIQDRIQQQLLFMTGIVIDEVNVVVSGMVPDKTTSDIDPNDIFSENNGDQK